MSLRALLVGSPLLAVCLTMPTLAQTKTMPGMVPFNPNSPAVQAQLEAVQSDTVEQFDPVARAQVLARELPSRWSGTYLASGAQGESMPVSLNLASITPMGQMIVLRGTLKIGSLTIPVQGNINAKSDQLDLLILRDASAIGLEMGGEFLGLQTFQLSSWEGPRLTTPGGKLTLIPRGGGRRG